MSDNDCDCSISWHYSVNAVEQHRKLLEVDSWKCRKDDMFELKSAYILNGLMNES